MSTTLPYSGTYDWDIALPCRFCAGSTADSRTQYCTSLISSTLDCLVIYYIGYYTLSAGSPGSSVTPTFGHIMFVSSATTIYVLVYFSAGSNTFAILNGETCITCTTIA